MNWAVKEDTLFICRGAHYKVLDSLSNSIILEEFKSGTIGVRKKLSDDLRKLISCNYTLADIFI